MGLADFFDFCEKYGRTAAVIILLGFAAAALFFPIFKDKILYKFRHKRNRWYFFFAIVYAIMGLLLFELNLTTSKWLVVLMGLDVVYFIICIYTMDHELPYAHHMLQKYERFLEDGLASEHIDYFESKHLHLRVCFNRKPTPEKFFMCIQTGSVHPRFHLHIYDSK
ncbi:MAG: hypothetical protein LUE87_10175 [Lachnospiraceae bacterium]|nr:hypothetical protein [Lachnospiraceae bacterium]